MISKLSLHSVDGGKRGVSKTKSSFCFIIYKYILFFSDFPKQFGDRVYSFKLPPFFCIGNTVNLTMNLYRIADFVVKIPSIKREMTNISTIID